MRYFVTPYVGIHTIEFGNTISLVHNKIGEPLEQFYRGPDNTCLTDVYQDFFVYYKDRQYVEAIEFYGYINVCVEEITIGDETFDCVLKAFSQRDSEIILDEDGFTSKKYGIGVYCPSWRESEELLVESIIVFCEGYYD